MIHGIYPVALDCGIDPFSFWNMSLDEIKDIIESYERKELLQQKQRAIDNSILADQIVKGIAALFSQESDDVEIKQIWDYYPTIFEVEKNKAMQEHEFNEFESFKEKRRRFAYNHNKQIRGDD